MDTSITGAAGAFTYGRSGSVTATISPATATGRVEVLYGSTVIATGTLSGGKATASLPAKSLPPGTPTLTVRYVGDSTHQASTATVRVVVNKAAPTIRVQAPKKVKSGAQATVKVRVAAPDGVPVTGKVSVAIKGGKTIVGTVKKSAVVVRLPAAKGGKLSLKVTYLGSDVAAKVVKSATIKVVRKR